jgi:hypothetical protein
MKIKYYYFFIFNLRQFLNMPIINNEKIVDISKNPNIYKIFNESITKKWIKIISMDKTISLDSYDKKDYFKLVADVIMDTDNRNTVIKFVPKIPKIEFEKKDEWIYLFTINDRIVKIGGTRTGLKGRVSSYLCGHHIKERGKSGDCSKTNGYIYNTFDFYLNNGCNISMYAYKLPKIEIDMKVLDDNIKMPVQTYHIYESKFIEDYKKKYLNYPYLSTNRMP